MRRLIAPKTELSSTGSADRYLRPGSERVTFFPTRRTPARRNVRVTELRNHRHLTLLVVISLNWPKITDYDVTLVRANAKIKSYKVFSLRYRIINMRNVAATENNINENSSRVNKILVQTEKKKNQHSNRRQIWRTKWKIVEYKNKVEIVRYFLRLLVQIRPAIRLGCLGYITVLTTALPYLTLTSIVINFLIERKGTDSAEKIRLIYSVAVCRLMCWNMSLIISS